MGSRTGRRISGHQPAPDQTQFEVFGKRYDSPFGRPLGGYAPHWRCIDFRFLIGPGIPPFYDPDPGYPYIVVAVKSNNYMRIEINGSSLFFTAFDENNAQLDSFMLTNSCSAIFTDGFEAGNLESWSQNRTLCCGL